MIQPTLFAEAVAVKPATAAARPVQVMEMSTPRTFGPAGMLPAGLRSMDWVT